jgi:hypothetical protein
MRTGVVKHKAMELDEQTYESCLKRLKIEEDGFMLISVYEIKEKE